MKIKSVNMESTLGNHLYLSKIVFGEDSPAVQWLQEQIDMYEDGENYPVDVEEKVFFTKLMMMHREQ